MNGLRRWGALGVVVAAVVGMAGCRTFPATPAGVEAYELLGEDGLREAVGRLADPAIGGRMTGSRGNAIAGDYIAERMAAIGLQPVGDDGTFFQGFLMSNVHTAGGGTKLAVGSEAMTRGEDFDVMAAGISGEFSGPLVFAGFGLSEDGYDDYADIDTDGAVVMILIGTPDDNDDWDPRLGIVAKLQTAHAHGAVAALVVAPEYVSPEADPLEDVFPRREMDGKIPAMRLSRAVADRLLVASGQADSLGQLVAAIRDAQTPRSFAMNETISGKVELVWGTGRNVIGFLPPTDASPEVAHIVVGAHYDHLSSWGDWRGQDVGFGPRPGADDNASGTAAMLAAAEAMAALPERRCGYVFIAFSGEEYGFVGSSRYVDNPFRPLDECPVMVNLDQMGSVTGDGVNVMGSVMDADIGGMLSQANRDGVGMAMWTWALKGTYFSDDSVFHDAGVEALFFYGGAQDDTYHQRSDRPDTLNYRGLHREAVLVFDLLRHFDAYYGPAREDVDADSGALPVGAGADAPPGQEQ